MNQSYGTTARRVPQYQVRALAGVLWLVVSAVWQSASAQQRDTQGAAAQQRDPVPSAGIRVAIESSILGEERVLWVWTPPGYAQARPGLPVLYLLDGEVHYRHAAALAHFLSSYLRAPELIVVGVVNTNRTRDLIPSQRTDSVSGEGGGERFLRFLTEEVQPYVRQNFRTAPFSILVGHSLGGLFAVHTMVTRPASFSAYIAMSPSLDWADSLVVREARDGVERAQALPRFAYLALAGTERPGISASTRALAETLTAARPVGLTWDLQQFPGENHLTVPLPALHAALRWLFADWPIPIDGTSRRIADEQSLAPFAEHYTRLSGKFGYPAQPSELAFSMVGDRLYQARQLELANQLFARRVALYPESPEAHDELGRGYEAAGRLALAVASYQRALLLAQQQQHPSLEAIRKRLERARAAQRGD